MEIKKVGIIGSGQMGSGIAQICAATGYHVILQDISQTSLDKAHIAIEKSLDKQIKKAIITDAQKKNSLKNISYKTDIQSFSDCDLIIEAATENIEIKEAIFKKITPILSKDCLLASNTSALSITKLASFTDRPDRFMGVHFMNPVPIMTLVELIKGLATSAQTFDILHAFITSLGKKIATSEDYPGFIVNRILIPMINEAIYILQEGIGNAQSIDKSMTLGAGFPMGPLALADFIGLDTCLAIMNRLHQGMGDSKYRPCPLLIKYVEAGWLGKKTNQGFYSY